MEEDDFSFDFESKLEEQQKLAAAAPGPVRLPGNAAVPVNQSAGSFKRNYRQTVCTYWLKGVCALGDNCGFLHEFNAERMPVCKTLIRFGVCKEPDCPYKHTLTDIKECNMFKLGFCIYGPQCRYRHTRLPGPPPDPKEVDAAKPKEYRAGGKDAERHEGMGGRGRGRYQPYGRGRGEGPHYSGGRGGAPRPPPPRPPPLEGPQQPQQRKGFEGGGPPRRFDGPRPPPPRPPGMISEPHGMGFGGPHPGMMGMPGMMPGGMMPHMGMPMGMPPFWRPPMGGPFPPPYGYR